MDRILVTGITGKSGRFFYENLVEKKEFLRNYDFKALVRKSSDISRFSNSGVNIKFFYGDITNVQSMDQFCAGNYEVLFHIAGIHWTPIVVQAAIKAGVTRIIVVHTTGIYSKYKSAGDGYRRIDEETKILCSRNGVLLTILRPTMIYGDLGDRNISIFIKMVDKLRVFPLVDGGIHELQPVWCKDLGDAYFQVLSNLSVTAGKEYNLSGGDEITFRDMLLEIQAQLGVKNVFFNLPYWVAYSAVFLVFVFSFGVWDLREKVQRLVEPRVYSHEAATRDFGYRPARFRDGIKSEIFLYKEKNCR
jgi:nucleoside-diphosphate-sugar epimerase